MRANRLLPGRIMRLDPDLFGRLEALARGREGGVEALVVEILYTAIHDLEGQSGNSRRWELLTRAGGGGAGVSGLYQ